MAVYNRAELSRTAVLVVALSLTAVATSAVAREFRAADAQSEAYATGPALHDIGHLIAERGGGRHQIGLFDARDFDRKPFEAAMAGAYDNAQRDLAAAELIERIRKVE